MFIGCIEWFSSALMDIATAAAATVKTSTPLDLHISIYITCLCVPEAVPVFNCEVTMIRPSIYQVLNELTCFKSPPISTEPSRHRSEGNDVGSDLEYGHTLEDDCEVISEIREGARGGVAVCVRVDLHR